MVGTAKLLVHRLNNLGRDDALYLPNAANEYIFDKYKSYTRPDDLPRNGGSACISVRFMVSGLLGISLKRRHAKP